MTALQRNPLKMAFLKRLDILFVEEIGLFTSSMFAIIDLILRQVRDVQQPLGGVLCIATGDNEQLAPVNGSSFFRITHIGTLFKVVQFKHLVRSRGDSQLQELISLLRRHDLKEEEKARAVGIVRNMCSKNFVKTLC